MSLSSNLIHHNLLLAAENMMASSCLELNEEELCPFLKEMDKKELKLLEEEDGQMKEKNGWNRIHFLSGGLVVTCIGWMVFPAIAIGHKAAALFSGIMTLVISGAVVKQYDLDLQQETAIKYSLIRSKRLDSKVKTLSSRIELLKNKKNCCFRNHNSDIVGEIEQLKIAKSYFSDGKMIFG